METQERENLHRRDFIKATTLASTVGVLGAFTVAANTTAHATTTNASENLHASLSEAEIAALPRVKQELVAPPFVPKHDQVAVGGPKVIEITMSIKELLWQGDSEKIRFLVPIDERDGFAAIILNHFNRSGW